MIKLFQVSLQEFLKKEWFLLWLELPDHQHTFCTRKTSISKTGDVHKPINFCLLKTYGANDYKKSLGQSVFLNYNFFDNADVANSDFFQKNDSYWQNCSHKTKRVKGNSQKRFDGEILEKLNSRVELFRKSKRSILYIDIELFKKGKNWLQQKSRLF